MIEIKNGAAMIAALLTLWAVVMAVPTIWSLGTVLWLRGKDYVDTERSKAAAESVRRKRDEAILRSVAHRRDIN